ELERLLHGHHRLHALERLEQPEIRAAALLADGGDDGLELPADDMGRVAHLRDSTTDIADLDVAGSGPQHDDHGRLLRGTNESAAGCSPAALVSSLSPRAGDPSARGSSRSAHRSQWADGRKVKVRPPTRGDSPA